MTHTPSPLERAEDAKHRRDIVGELDALMSGHASLEDAPWYPAQPGDQLLVHNSALGDKIPEWGETYEVTDDLRLRLIGHNAPDPSYAGSFAPGLAGDPLMEAWMECGPQSLTVVRSGRIIHLGPRPQTSAPGR